MAHYFSSPSHRYTPVDPHDSDSDMDDQQRDAIETAKSATTGASRSGQSVVRRGSSASPPDSPDLSQGGHSPSLAASGRRQSTWQDVLSKSWHRHWKRYLLGIAVALIVVIVVVALLVVRPWATTKRSAPLNNDAVKALPANQPLWPIPKAFSFGNDSVVLKDDFLIQISPPATSTPLLDKAITRYIRLLRAKLNRTSTPEAWAPPPLRQPLAGERQHPVLGKLSIQVKDPHASLAYGMEESYSLSISVAPLGPGETGESSMAAAAVATLVADTQWGVLRGLDTFVQLVHPTDPTDSLQNPASEALPTLGIANVPWAIQDKPKYSHRGLLLDTSRNYYPVKDILRTLDAMAIVKLNVFHWHVLDQQYYPLVSKAFPQLTQYGAEAWDRVYTPEDVASIVKYGEERGIRVLPEFDTPGHTASWGRAFPNITVCLDAQPHQTYAAEPPAGQLDPLEPFTYKLLYTLIGEWATQFPDKQAHVGGDEVNFNCWKTNERIRDYIQHSGRRNELTEQLLEALRQEDVPQLVDMMKDEGSSGSGFSTAGTHALRGQSGEDKLLDFFLTRLFRMYEERGKTPIVWEEMAIEHDVKLPESAIVQVWKKAANARKVPSIGTWTVGTASGSLVAKAKPGVRMPLGSEARYACGLSRRMRTILIRLCGLGLRRQRKSSGVDHKTQRAKIGRYCMLQNGCLLSGNG
ncbi:hypothetical protein BGZ73_004429 [Actinomortierella ambigua]|nr:hypothetical protein BGZ73_004429 [Actinomortierella ambigua]